MDVESVERVEPQSRIPLRWSKRRRSEKPPPGAVRAWLGAREYLSGAGPSGQCVPGKATLGWLRRARLRAGGRCEADVWRLASAGRSAAAAGGFATGRGSGDFGRLAHSGRDARERGGAPQGAPGTSVPTAAPRRRGGDPNASMQPRKPRGLSQPPDLGRVTGASQPRLVHLGGRGSGRQANHLGGGLGTPGRATGVGGARYLREQRSGRSARYGVMLRRTTGSSVDVCSHSRGFGLVGKDADPVRSE